LIGNEIKRVFFLFILAVVLKGIYVLYVYLNVGTSGWNDAFYYIHLGEQIVQGNWNPDGGKFDGFIVAPVVPLLVALFIMLFNEPIIPFLIYNVLVTGAMVCVLYCLGKTLFNSFAAWGVAIWGVFFIDAYYGSTSVLKEPTLFLLLPLVLLLIVKSVTNQKYVLHTIGAVFAFSLLIHTDERFIIYFPFLLLVFVFRKPFHLTTFYKQSLIWVLGVLLLMLPWAIRNYHVYDQLVLLTPRTTAFTSKLWGENISTLSFGRSDEPASYRVTEWRINEAKKFEEQHGVNPREYGKTEAKIRAFIHFWRPLLLKPAYIQYGYRGVAWSPRGNIRMMAYYGIFLPFYLFGFFFLYKRKMHVALLIALIPVIHSLLHAYMVWPIHRYRAPILFIVVMIGMFVIGELLSGNRFFEKYKTQFLSRLK
jgi:hypothetical protein